MKICVLVKEVPDAAVEKRMDPNTKRLDRSGEKNLNPFDTHAIEAAMQVKEGGQSDVEEIVRAFAPGRVNLIGAVRRHGSVSFARLIAGLVDEHGRRPDVDDPGLAGQPHHRTGRDVTHR